MPEIYLQLELNAMFVNWKEMGGGGGVLKEKDLEVTKS